MVTLAINDVSFFMIWWSS